MKRILSIIIQYPKTVILGIVIATGFFAFNITQNLKFATDFESFFDHDSQNFDTYQAYKSAFLKRNSNWFIVVETTDSALKSANLTQMVRLTRALSELDEVNDVNCLADLYSYSRVPILGSVLFERILFSDDSTAQINGEIDPGWYGTLLAGNGKGYSVSLSTNHDLSIPKVDRLSQQIDSVMHVHSVVKYHMTGELLAQLHLTQTTEKEMGFHLAIALLLVTLILILLYKSIWNLVAFMFTLITSIIWIMGVMVVFGKEIDVVSSIIPPIIFILGTSDLIHLYEAYTRYSRTSESKKEAVLLAVKRVGRATLFTSLTTGIGFLSLAISSIPTIKELGIYVSVGVVLTLVLTYTLFLAFLILLPKPKTKKVAKTDILLTGALKIIAYPNSVLTVSFALLVAGIWMSAQLKIDNYVTEELPKNNSYNESYRYIEDYYSGSRSIDIAIHATDNGEPKANMFAVLSDIYVLDSLVRKKYQTNLTFSILDRYYLFADAIDPLAHVERPAPNQRVFDEIKRDFYQSLKTSASKNLLDSSLTFFRLAGFSTDLGGTTCRRIDAEIETLAENNLAHIRVNFTGLSHMIDLVNQQIVKDMILALIAAIIAVSLVIAISFKSFRSSIIVLIPNLIPLIMTASLMYVLQIDLKIASILIFVIAFGIAVDDSIHFLSSYKEAIRLGLDRTTALKETYFHTGRSIFLTTFILLVGFFSLSFSELNSSYYMGILTSCTLLFALFADLILLPVLLQLHSKQE